MNPSDNLFAILLFVAGMSFLPLIAVTVTGFAKISIVIFIVRNALGIQQLPPNIIVYGLSLILSVYIAMPVMNTAYTAVRDARLTYKTFSDYEEAGSRASKPLETFLRKHTDPAKLTFFVQSTGKIWAGDRAPPLAENSLAVLVPAFLLTELTKAFEIGFLLYLPFMAIDIIVTTVLVALGLMMIPPNTIATPFKLLLFTFVDGWTKIVQGLVLSYI
ncbi:putative translocation protein y4yL [Alsobacter metallidurans]|uniref:Translocation protein y4yL n=1 Tax=Alsobacter metallidurans TaxID=340221 RepID=A0A917IBQ1_9HYPH|nr:type III secretion system export apparatus subunit SctR [Alsobacter metallidurans]GGH32048.1 putative translocation protein y4yL [Alsobacter metallidurans]